MTGAEEQAIVDVIEKFIKAGIMFTAFDVTKEVRSNVRGLNHGQAKGVVHNFQFPQNYTRTIIQVPGVPVKPWVYHPKGADITSYKPGKVDLTSTPSPIAVQVKKIPVQMTTDAALDASAQSGKPTSDKTGLFTSTLQRLGFVKNPLSKMIPTPTFKSASGFIVNLDARGRYCLRASVIGSAGLFPGDKVFMYINEPGKEILLIKTDVTSQPKKTPATTMTVDKDSNLQLFRKYIVSAFGAVPTKFDLTTDKNSVKIKAG